MSRTITYRQAINEALMEEMERDSKVLILGEDMCNDQWDTHTGLVGKFGKERVRDTTISENFVIGAGVGAALAGYRPICDIMFSDFMYCACDELLNAAATVRYSNGGKNVVPMVVKTAIGGFIGAGPMHSQTMEAFCWHRPGLKIALPSTPYDAKGLLKSAIRDNNAVMFLYHKALMGSTGEVPEQEYTIPLGVADVKRKGSDITVISTSLMSVMAMDVADQLAEKNISAEVVDLRCLEPFDLDTVLASVKKTGKVVIVNEDVERCGVTGEIAMQIMENAYQSLSCPIKRVAAKNLPVPAGCLEKDVLPKRQDIADAIGHVLGIKEKLTIQEAVVQEAVVVG
jgi:pyruvate/2-oxoglutarate/acetoin dehydrogenase E1 component